MGLAPCFGRGDNLYKKTENKVLSKLKKISGHKNDIASSEIQFINRRIN